MPASLPSDSELLPALLTVLDGPAVLCDGEGRVLRVNPGFERLTGRSGQDVHGENLWDALLPPDRAGEIEALFLRIRSGEETAPSEVRFPGPGGREIAVVWAHSVLRDPEGEPFFVLCTGTDVTRLRELEEEARSREVEDVRRLAREEALRDSEARFSGIVELASDAIISVDESHRIVLFNQGAEAIFGYRAEEILGRPLDHLLPPAARARHSHHIRKFASSRVTARRMAEREEISGLRKSGEEFPAEASILKLEVDGRRLFTVVLRDISQRVRAEAHQRFLSEVGAVLASSLEMEATLRSVGDLTVRELAHFCIVDLVEEDGSVRRIHATHRDPEKAELAEAFLALSLDRSHPHLTERTLRTGEPELVTDASMEHLAHLAQGEEHLALLRELDPRSYLTVPLATGGETVGALLGLRCRPAPPYDEELLDLAVELGRRAGMAVENARLYRRAREAVQARDDVLSVVSHDLGNPLQAITIALEALERSRRSRAEGGAGPEEYYVTAIRRSAEAMERLIRDLLEVRRMEAGRLVLTRSRQSLIPLVEEALEVLDPLARVKTVELECNLDPDLPPLEVDGDRIQQVLSNLVGNAVKHAPEGGRVTVEGAVEDAQVRISVRDTGPGIPREALKHVFDRFWRVKGGRGAGLGLGLAIARGIVLAHGGAIWAESESGKGAAFHFTLPLEPPEAGGESQGTTGEAVRGETGLAFGPAL